MNDTKASSFADRVKIALAADSPYTAARKLALVGRVIAPQTIYSWLNGGGADDQTLVDFARVYDVRLPWLRYGDGDQREPTEAERDMARLFAELPPELRRETLDILGYQVQRATALVASERTARYMTMIEKIKADMARLKGAPGSEGSGDTPGAR